MADDYIGQNLADTEGQRTEYGLESGELDVTENESVTVYHEIANFKVDIENIGSPTPTIFVLGHELASNVGSMPLGGYHSATYIYSDDLTTTDYLEAGSTTATWDGTGSITY